MSRDVDNSTFNRFQQAREDVIHDYSKNKKAFIGSIIGIIIASIIISSWVTQYILLIFGDKEYISIAGLFTAWTTNIVSLIFTGIVIFALCKGTYKIRKWTSKDYTQDYDENYKLSDYGIYGDAHWQTEEERKECFSMEKDINKIKDDILGIDKKGRIYSLRTDLIGINKNKLAIGAAGSGKTAAIINNDIMQCIRRGESMIVTDSKGDVYRYTSSIARKHGYIVRVLNLKPKELKNSDAWDPLKYVTEEDDIQADVLANAIIENTEDGPMDYWAKNEMGALKAAILLVATTPDYEENRSFGEVINVVSHPQSFDSKFYGLPNDHPAKTAFDIYASCKDDVKKQILNGLAIRMRLLNNKYVKHIVSHDEIDPILPMKRKCIYYIIISDTDTTMKFVASMFFTQIFMLQGDYSDSLTKEKKKAQLPVSYELDEFANIGKIPYFDVKISTFRSRKIRSTIILQGITKLEEMYPEKAHEIILANTTTKILLKAGDLTTAQYFSDICGQGTTKVENGRYQKARSQTLDMHDNEYMTEGSGQRMILMPDKAMKLHADIAVICILGFQPIKLNKYICEQHHPMYKESVETPPNRHKPRWRKELEEQERESERRLEELKKESEAGHMILEHETHEKRVKSGGTPSNKTPKEIGRKPQSFNPVAGHESDRPKKKPRPEDNNAKMEAPKQPEPATGTKREPKPAPEPLRKEHVPAENTPVTAPKPISRKTATTNKPVYTVEELQIRQEIEEAKESKKGGRLAMALESSTKGDDLFGDIM